jgi:hypothetical protein
MDIVRTQIIDPITHSQILCELRLDPYKVYTNLRIAGLGATSAANACDYVDLSGVYSLINRIVLYDGSTVLDVLDNAHEYLAFQNTLSQNGLDYSLYSVLKGTSRSFTLDPVDGVKSAHLLPKRSAGITTNADTTFLGWLNLASCFNLLNKLPMLDTTLLKNLRIVIEWRKSLGALKGAGDVLTILAPQLLADEILDADGGNVRSLPDKSYAVSFVRRINEIVTLDGTTVAPGAETKKTVKTRLNAFNGMVVNRMLMITQLPANETSAAATDRLKADTSISLPFLALPALPAYRNPNSVFQLTVNGQTVFDFSGVDSRARKSQYLCDAWGDVRAPLHANYEGDPANYAALFADDTTTMVGKIAYGGVVIGNRVSELDISHDYYITVANYSTKTLEFVGEVNMNLMVDGSAYNVSFA